MGYLCFLSDNQNSNTTAVTPRLIFTSKKILQSIRRDSVPTTQNSLGVYASLQGMAELDEISRVQRKIFGVNGVLVGV